MKTTPVLRARMRLAAKACTAQIDGRKCFERWIQPRALAVIRVRVQPNTVGQGIKDKWPGLRRSAGSAEKMFLNW
jgi:hypothetical protein